MGRASHYSKKLAETASDAQHANVHVLPSVPLEEVWEYTCSADVGVVLTQPICLSYKYSESNKVYEYMVAGLPILASTIPSHERLHSETGALVLADSRDPRDIARAACELLADRQRMKDMGRQARHWAEQRYNAATEMEKLVRAYERLGAPKTQ
jgi:glycosyltransferase involved in cell wall biosynthesis